MCNIQCSNLHVFSLQISRAPKFTSNELEAFVSAIEKRKTTIYGNHDGNINNVSKNRAWTSIAAELAGLGFITRDAQQLKKKKATLFNKIKAKVHFVHVHCTIQEHAHVYIYIQCTCKLESIVKIKLQ